MIYADANATFPVESKHYDLVASRLKEVDGNPSSIHARGRQAKVALEAARGSVARLVGARGPEIIFTSGATEANNLAIQGVIGLRGDPAGPLPQLIVTAAEHSSVIEAAKVLQSRGACTLHIAPVLKNGTVDEEALLALIAPQTSMVCLIYGNNEIGSITDIPALATKIKGHSPNVHVHTDAVQMLGKVDLTGLAKSGIDSASFSAHKIGAFKGVGALYLRNGAKLQLLIAGGGQERGRRPGTENMPGIVSFGIRADEVFGNERDTVANMARVRSLWMAALHDVPDVEVHGEAPAMLPNTVNFHVDGIPGDDILLNFDLAGIQASSGSACSSGVARPSHVLSAMGYSEWIALNSVRTSFTGTESEADIAHMAQVLQDVLSRKR